MFVSHFLIGTRKIVCNNIIEIKIKDEVTIY